MEVGGGGGGGAGGRRSTKKIIRVRENSVNSVKKNYARSVNLKNIHALV